MLPWKDRTALDRSIKRRQMREAELNRAKKLKERREAEAAQKAKQEGAQDGRAG